MTEATALRVKEAAEEFGYHLDHSASSLRSGRTKALGFLLLDDDRHFLADPLTDLILAGIGDVARDEGFEILIQAARPNTRNLELLGPLLRRRVDGAFLILSGRPNLRRWYVDQMTKRKERFVLFDERVETPGTMSVAAENEQGAAALTEHLISMGHSRIAFIAARDPWAVIEQRNAGYRRALKRSGLEPDPALELFEGGRFPEGGAEMARKLFRLAEPPTAIMATSDLLALGAIQATFASGRRVPNDLAVCGFDDFLFSEYVEPALTTVRVPGYEMGQLAATLLIEGLGADQPPPATNRVLPVQLRIRESA